MKKQIFILVFLLAGFANVSKSYGQLAPRKITCLSADALHPVAGTAFTYQIDVPATPTGGTAWTPGSLKYLWYVTQDPDFIKLDGTGTPVLTDASLRQKGDGTGTLLKTADVAKYNIPGNTSNSISLTWKSFFYDPNAPIFVVISVVGDNGICNPSNLKVFQIEPLNAFTLDIDNLKEDGSVSTPPVYTAGVLTSGDYGDLYEQCISPIQSAKYDKTAGGVVYDYGKNIMMYVVVAANWSTSWRPSFTLTGVDPKETITVEYSKDKTFAVPADIVTMTGPANSVATADVLTYTTATGIVTSAVPASFVNDAGESIYVRVTLDHSTATLSYQGLDDEKINLAVDGKTNLGAVATEVGDVNTTAGATLPAQACPWVDGFANDIAHQALKGRPTITSSTVGVAPNANPGPLLPVKP
jgi:hypothetical protein